MISAIGIALAISIYYHMTVPYSPNTIIGTVDHRKTGQGTDNAGQPLEWYTVSIRPINEDKVAGTLVGETLAYVVDKQDYDMVNANDIVVARISAPFYADIVQVVPNERWTREECVGPLTSDHPETPSEHYCDWG